MGGQARRFQWWHPALGSACRPDRAVIQLIAGVVAWWLLIVGVTGLTVPTPESSSNPTTFAFASGDRAYVSEPSGATWLIPVDRVNYEVARPFLDSDEEAMTVVRAGPGWVVVLPGQAVRVVDIDREAVQVDTSESPDTGGLGWLHMDYLYA